MVRNPIIILYFQSKIFKDFFTENIMNFYQLLFPKKIFLKKVGFGVIALQYLPILARAVSHKLFFFKRRLYMEQICGVAKKSRTC